MTKYTTEALQKKLRQDIRDMFKLEAQGNDINFALSGVERGDMTIQDYEDDLSLAISNYFVKDVLPTQQAALLDEVEKRLPEWEYKKLEPCPVCGDYQYSHSPGSHHDYAINQVRGILEAIRKELL